MLRLDTDLLELIGNDLPLRKMASTYGGEYAAPCPFCAGLDRFRVWPNHPSGRGRYWCRRCHIKGDAIDYVRQRDHVGFTEACKRLNVGSDALREDRAPRGALESALEPSTPLCPPPEKWQAQAQTFVDAARKALWSNTGHIALDWLYGRGLNDETIRTAGLGFNPVDQRQSPVEWGLDQVKPIWLPAGIVIPWQIDGELWRVNIRRRTGEPKYIGPAGNSNGLYGADALKEDRRPIVLVEGEFDKLSIGQEACGAVDIVATGATSGSRKPHWIALLAQAPIVLISFDADEGGEKAANYWLNTLPNSRRWRPYWEDVNAMLQDGISLKAWLHSGLESHSDSRD